MIANIQADTSHNAFCCCDIPERMLKVYSTNFSELFKECGAPDNKNVTALMDMLDKIANSSTYKKAKARFYFE